MLIQVFRTTSWCPSWSEGRTNLITRDVIPGHALQRWICRDSKKFWPVGFASFWPSGPGSRSVSMMRIRIATKSVKIMGNSHKNHKNIIFLKIEITPLLNAQYTLRVFLDNDYFLSHKCVLDYSPV